MGLSAAHCRLPLDAELEVWTSEGGVWSQLFVEAEIAHPDFDLLLLKLEPPGAAMMKLVAVASTLPARLTEQLVQVTGFAQASNPSERGMRFAVAEIVEAAESTFTVTAHGYAGACVGDSGGPAFGRSRSGAIEVWGILSGGAASCWGEDDYVRIDAAFDWIADTVGEPLEGSPSCGTLSNTGRCFGNRAVWCEREGDVNAVARVEECQDGWTCGWDRDIEGFRCVDPDDDPCVGISDLGVCDAGDALHCDGGELRRNACALCDASCARSPHSGVVTCILPG